MTWKTYAAVSGATVLAGWLASSPPANAPATTTSPAQSPRARPTSPAQSPRARPTSAASDIAASDIEAQAERLRTGLRGERTYTAPQRNPFRFEPSRAVDPGSVERGTAFEPEPEPVAAPSPPMTLSGIAEDQANGEISRTAVVSSPAGVELVREGDEVLGYRVARIESEAVELIRIADGTTRRLALRR